MLYAGIYNGAWNQRMFSSRGFILDKIIMNLNGRSDEDIILGLADDSQ